MKNPGWLIVLGTVAAGSYWFYNAQYLPKHAEQEAAANDAAQTNDDWLDFPSNRESLGPMLSGCNLDCRAEVRGVAAKFVAARDASHKIAGISTLEIQENTWLASVDVGLDQPLELIVRWYATEVMGKEGSSGDYWRADLVTGAVGGLALMAREPEKPEGIDDREPDPSYSE